MFFFPNLTSTMRSNQRTPGFSTPQVHMDSNSVINLPISIEEIVDTHIKLNCPWYAQLRTNFVMPYTIRCFFLSLNCSGDGRVVNGVAKWEKILQMQMDGGISLAYPIETSLKLVFRLPNCHARLMVCTKLTPWVHCIYLWDFALQLCMKLAFS